MTLHPAGMLLIAQKIFVMRDTRRENDEMNLAAEKIFVTLGGKEILRDVSYKFLSGKRTAIIGPNGAGQRDVASCGYAFNRSKNFRDA